jgi:cytosol alanyl aminopeptidase
VIVAVQSSIVHRGPIFVLALAAWSCGSPGASAPPRDPVPLEPKPPAADGAAPADATGTAVTPRAYRLELAIDPSAIGFTGTVTIDLDVAARTSAIWLDSRDLTIDSARLTTSSATGATMHDLAVIPDSPDGRLGLSLPRAIDPGEARLELTFSGDYRTDDGVFAQTYRAHTYVFSDFEPIDARRGFPCFDEPRWKTPWTISLLVPEGMTALSNAPAIATTEVRGGLARVEFATTPPLPSYLVAIAVGPFDVVAAEGGPVPTRIVVPSGRGAAAAQAASFAPELLETAAAFVDRPVPFDKLDIVAVPRFGGAMENPGLFTVAADILLDGRGDKDDRRLALVIAHEVAHLWFGDSVTLGDWRDLWINEGLASWMADEVLARWRPGWATRRDELRSRDEAMREDDLPGAHPLRPERLESPRALFDVLTYQKSAAVLHMIEGWVGEEKFVEALRGYLDRHGGATATSADVIAALDPLDPDLATVLESFLAAPGVPHLEATVSCRGGAKLELRHRGATHGDEAPAWKTPACVRWHDGEHTHRACTVVAGATELGLGDRCPTWVAPNAGGDGYYRWSLTGAPLAALIGGDGASDRERLDATAAIRGALGDGVALRDLASALSAAVRTGIPEVVEAALREYELLIEQLAPAGARKAIGAHLRAALAPSLRRLGTAPRRGEPADDRRLRVIVLTAAGTLAGDDKVIAWAKKTAKKWLRDHRKGPRAAELLEPALLVAAAHADDKLAALLVATAEGALDQIGTDATLVARALGQLPRERALRALDVAVGGALPSVTTFALAVELLGRRDTAHDAADTLGRHGDWLAIALTFAPTCDPDLVDRLTGTAATAPDGVFARGLERRRLEATRCDALRPMATGAARAFGR